MKPIIMAILIIAAFGFFFYNIYNLFKITSFG